ncbi:MAG: MBL fold metallo-hydrolase, partial [Candidatus Neomarinimicrobiota bacterium]|nr:MBL fold metallo-hydrolase [Candidatus Neomarinimicrobiota bacterium]
MAETDFSIRSFKGGYDSNLTYLVSCMRTGNQLLIDASVSIEQINPFINKRGLIAIFITHTHSDHLAYLDEYLENFSDLVVMVHRVSEMKIKSDYVKPIKNGDIISIGQLNF